MIKVLRVDMAVEVCFLQFKFEISMDFAMIFNDYFYIQMSGKREWPKGLNNKDNNNNNNNNNNKHFDKAV